MLDINGCTRMLFDSYTRAKPSGYDSQSRDLAGMRELFALADVPTSGLPTITVTGSKGKGSTALLCSAMLEGLGHKVGLVLSPHLVDFRERIRVGGEAIREGEFVTIFNELAPYIQAVDKQLQGGKYYLSPTGLILAGARRHFANHGVTALVLEAGRGGRFDDVALFDNSVTCLTPIMEEHLDKLGPTIAEVAWHKAGLIKAGSTVVSAPQVTQVKQLVQAEATAQGATLLQVGRDILYQQRPTAPYEQEVTVAVPTASLSETFCLTTAAVYQGVNVAVAYGAVSALAAPQPMQGSNMAATVERLRFAGRCEKLADQPTVLVDGAINGPSAAQFLESALPLLQRPLILVTALPQDKEFRGFLQCLMPLADETIITRASNPHLHFTDEVLSMARSLSENVTDQPDVMAALSHAVGRAGPDGMVWVVGTQSLVRDALCFWGKDVETIWLP